MHRKLIGDLEVREERASERQKLIRKQYNIISCERTDLHELLEGEGKWERMRSQGSVCYNISTPGNLHLIINV
jgi:hypothetical protein